MVVSDGGGNTLVSQGGFSDRWWEERREQFSYYLGTPNGLELLGRDFDAPFQVGLAELYRDFTYFLGWHSYTYASKTMALAGLGRRDAIEGEPFDFNDGFLTSPVENTPYEPIEVVLRLSRELGVDFGQARAPDEPITQQHCDVAAFIQRGVETALRRKLSYLARQTGERRLCLAGGLALNVVANGVLQDIFPEGVYVPSAPGDDGQGLGNVYALLNAVDHDRIPKMTKSSDAYVGPDMEIGSGQLALNLLASGLSQCLVFETSNFAASVASILASGSTVCLFGARSELGPRALGSRSILADPRNKDVAGQLNAIKERESFMPFAPIVLTSKMEEHFLQYQPSPFMSFAFRAEPDTVEKLPAVIHADRTARVQTVADDDQSEIANILSQYEAATGIGVLLNTSFNLGGHPIVETVRHATDSFRDMPIPVLGIGRFLVVKREDCNDLPEVTRINNLPASLCVRQKGQDLALRIDRGDVSTVLSRISDLTASIIFVRVELPLYSPYLRELYLGRKRTTTRFRRGGVEVPADVIIPLVETPDFKRRDIKSPKGHVRVTGVRYQKFGDLDEKDAANDGFDSLASMREGLSSIYSCLSNEDWVTVYEIVLLTATD